MKKSLIAATVLLGATASSASAQTFYDNNMRGSDTLFTVTTDLLTDLGIPDADLHYAGSGSGNGQTDIINGDQELAPMSRFNNNAACTGGTAPTTAGCWRIGRDQIAIYGNQGSACNALVYNETLTIGDANANGSVDCPGCTGAGLNEFSTSDWRTVLRVVYAGQLATPANTSRDCNSDIRHTLVNNWDTLFKDTCAAGNCGGGLRHAFRRDDFSGTTDSFLELLAAPVNSQATPSFCNGTDRDDNDPIRRACSGTGFGAEPTPANPTPAPANGEQICRKNAAAAGTPSSVYHLGLVLPVAIPTLDPYSVDSGAQAQRNCGTAASGGAASGPVIWLPADAGLYAGASATLCPNGAPVRGGNCQWPKVSGTGATPGTGFGCVAGKNDRPAGSPLSLDARIYNLIARTNAGAIKTYTRGTATGQRVNRAFYKYQQLNGCTFSDATENIACFANTDECSIGFAGNGSLSNLAFTDIVGIGLKNKTGAAATVYPVDTDFAVYGLARFLYMCTWDDFASTTNAAGTIAQTPEFIAGQQDIKAELTSPTGSQAIFDAVDGNGFLAFPANQALVFDQCPEGGI